MQIFRDYQGRTVRLPGERLAHIQRRPEMVGMEWAIRETLEAPEEVRVSRSDAEVKLYYRRYTESQIGVKLLCVVVWVGEDDAFIMASYFTTRMKRGTRL